MTEDEVLKTKELFDIAQKTVRLDDYRNRNAEYCLDIVNRCHEIANEENMSTNSIGRMAGDWFEISCCHILTRELGADNLRMYVGDGHSHRISEIAGFENVSWIPYPDVIVINEQDFRAVVSLKWGMRHDRMYEVGYSAFAIKDILKDNNRTIHFYLLTNDDSPSRIATLLNIPAIDGVFHMNPNFIREKNNKRILDNVLRPLEGMDELLAKLRTFISQK